MTLCTSVVAKMNFTCGGGSSRVLSRAFHPFAETMWHSSMITTLKRSRSGRYGSVSCSRRTSSTPLFEAPSISCTSGSRPSAISRHAAHCRHGSAVTLSRPRQFSDRARIRAMVVLPTPRAPVKRNACDSRSCVMALCSVRTTCSWPARSAKVCGRHLRASTR